MKWNLGPVKVLVFVALLATLIPAIFTIKEAGRWDAFQGVLPKGTADSLYYYARVHEVIDGHPLVGNPYVYEYRDTLAPAFFLPDVLSSIPMLVGVPFNIAVMVNVFIWSFVFLILAFTLFRLLELPKGYALIWSALLYISAYSFMLRPVGMQISYPVFLAFLIVLLRFLHEPFNRRRVVWLTLVSALTFYIYTYLSYIVILAFFFVLLGFLFTRRFKELRALINTGAFIAILLIPFGIFTLMQMKSAYYLETFNRIGLVFTHIPSIEAFFYGRWVVIGMLLVWLVPIKQKIFWLSTGASLLVGLFLNVITGVELTLAVHIGRFVLLWMVVFFGVSVYEWYLARTSRESRSKHVLYIITATLLVVLAVGVVRNTSRRLGFFEFKGHPGYSFIDTQSYAKPLKWFEENVEGQSVIWANDSIAQHIPIMTRHYPLFSGGAGLHSISTAEVEDRYLLSRSLYNLTIEDLKREFGIYAGAGPSKEQPRIQNQRAWLCEKTRRFIGSDECPAETDSITLRGEEYFTEMSDRFKEIKQDRNPLLEKFHVEYIIIDQVNDKAHYITWEKALYDDGRFVIFKVD